VSTPLQIETTGHYSPEYPKSGPKGTLPSHATNLVPSRPKTMRILHVAAELDGFHKTGGLGDAVLGMASAAAKAGHGHEHDVVIVIPRTAATRIPGTDGRADARARARDWALPVFLPPHGHGSLAGAVPNGARVLEVALSPGLRVCVVDLPGLFDRHRQGLYGDAEGEYRDNMVRFCAFSALALEVGARAFQTRPQIIHAHDWHAAASVLMSKVTFGWDDVKTVFTLHNAAHQGQCGDEVMPLSLCALCGFPAFLRGMDFLGDHRGGLNLVKGAVAVSDAVTTVSPRHAWELTTREGGFGLHEHFHYHRQKLSGILNGSEASVVCDKREAKAQLAEMLGLDASKPLASYVGRLAFQKGVDVLLQVLPMLVEQCGANVVLLGTGEPGLEQALRDAAARFPGRVSALLRFDTPLSMLVYAASDIVVVPSRFEPCGLVQLYAMQHGAIPVVSRTGGLLDSVQPFDRIRDEGDGFLAEPGDAGSLALALTDACQLLQSPVASERLRTRLMQKDLSWDKSGKAYLALYERLLT
jgi:starch synthase